MAKYATNTEVSVDGSRAELERTLRRYGATAYAYAWHGTKAMISFEVKNRRYRLILPLPDIHADEFIRTPSRGNRRSPQAIQEAWEQACRQRWRALNLVVKSALEADEIGIIKLEQSLFSAVVLPNGQTLAEVMLPQIEEAYRTGRMPPMLPELTEDR